MNRKRICLITISPETETPKRIMTGVFSQCSKFGYDVVVVTAMASVCNYYKNYLEGELNIYNIINPDLFDGFIITPVPMTEDNNFFLYNSLLESFKDIKKPVVSVDAPFGDFPVVYTDDKSSFFHITEHLINKHDCKIFDILSGPDLSHLTNERLEGIFEAFEKHKISFNKDHIFRGDYWYDSGEKLADRYISGELDLPHAVICLSDHMAVGLVNRLIKNNIRVPQDVIVTGFGAVREAALNTLPITSCVPYQSKTGKAAVDYLHNVFEKQPVDKSYIESDEDPVKRLKLGMTCGCPEDVGYTRAYTDDGGRSLKYNYNDNEIWNNIDMTMLQESYMTEKLTAVDNPRLCLEKIYESKYLLKPYKHFYICLNHDWLEPEKCITKGYENTMNLALSAEFGSKLHGYEYHVFFGPENEKTFPVTSMLPAFETEFEEPQVFYFTPLHFGSESLGYAVLQNDLREPGFIGEVYRNYLRIINNALEMSRAKYRITYLSEHDAMTGLKNRRGMETFLETKMQNAQKDDMIFAIVIDMDGLKKRNDSYGHSEGDKGITLVAQATKSITSENEVCVRGGGDEFFVLGIGSYTKEMLETKLSNFAGYLETANETMEYPVEASIGYSLMKFDEKEGFEVVLDKADVKMYEAKNLKKSGAKK